LAESYDVSSCGGWVWWSKKYAGSNPNQVLASGENAVI